MLEKIQCKLRGLASKDEIDKFKYFHKTQKGGYAYEDKFLGISVPKIRSIAKEVYENISMDNIEALLCSDYHEERLCALLILVFQYDFLDKKEEIVNAYLNNTKYINGWDLVDLSAPKILGKYVFETKQYNILLNLAKSQDMWEQRIAIVSNWYLIQKGKLDIILEIADMHLNSEHDLIQKAVGWMLREVGKRDYNLEYDFLVTRYKKMPRTMLRYSIEKFEEVTRKKFLKGEI